MPLTKPKEYGASVAPFKSITTSEVTLTLINGGLNKSVPADKIDDSESPEATDVRFAQGGVSTDYGYTNFGSAYAGGDKPVMAIMPYELSSAVKFLMRIRATGWDRWNGTNWLTLSGALTGTTAHRVSSAIQQDLFVLANGVDKLKRWDGNDGTAIADLSADSPVASYITRIGSRILAARLKIGGVLKPNYVAWSADGNILDWTTVAAGAGAADLVAEGASRRANYITGLSTVSRGAVVYRQQAIALGLLTGISSAPFRFTTVDFSHGTESPYSIVNGGIKTGDFFFGSDYMPYNFTGESEPIPIGGPIHDELLSTVIHPKEIIGIIDTNEQEYWITSPVLSEGILSVGWAFSIREWVLHQKLVWRKRNLPLNSKGFGYGTIATISDPIVDTLSLLVNQYTNRVDDWGRQSGPDRLMFGDTNGQIVFLDNTLPVVGGSWASKQLTVNGHRITIDRTMLKYTSLAGGTIAVSVSFDGGVTWSSEKVATLLPTTPKGVQEVTVEHRVTGKKFQIRLRSLTGFGTVSEIQITYQDLGMANG